MIDAKYEFEILITVRKINKYLLSKGWNINYGFPNKNLVVFEKYFDDDLFSIRIPVSEDFKDYGIRIKEAIELLSELEERPTKKIVEDILELNKKPRKTGFRQSLFDYNKRVIRKSIIEHNPKESSHNSFNSNQGALVVCGKSKRDVDSKKDVRGSNHKKIRNSSKS